MKKNNLFKIILFCLIFFSCKKKGNCKGEIIIKKDLLKKGEWIKKNDSNFGISIRDNKLAFFQNMKFTSDDIFEYLIFDSITKCSDSEVKIEFIKLYDYKDTIYFKIIERNNLEIKLINSKNEILIYNTQL